MSEKKDEWGFVPFPDNYHPIVQPKTYTKADIIKLAEEVVKAESESEEARKLYDEAFYIWNRAGNPE